MGTGRRVECRRDNCMANAVLLLCEAALYFGAMVGLFRMRKRIGIGVFMCALGVMHFLETYLAGVFYVATPVGMLSPGSTVLFSGKLVMLLLLDNKEEPPACASRSTACCSAMP